MKKYLAPILALSLALPIIGFAHVTSSPAHMATHSNTVSTQSGKNTVQSAKKRVLSGELKLKRNQIQQRTQSGSTWTGRIIPTTWSFSGTIKKPVVKSTFETAAERQRQREADLEAQHKEQQEQEDRQRAIKAAYDAKMKAEEQERIELLQQRQPGESIENYCARADRQWFLNSRIRVDTVQKCIDKLKKQIRRVARGISNNRRSATEQTLRRLCNEEYQKTGNIPTFCEGYVTRTWSGNTQTGGTLTATR